MTQTLRSKGSSWAGGIAGQVWEPLHLWAALDSQGSPGHLPSGDIAFLPLFIPFPPSFSEPHLGTLGGSVPRRSLCPRAAWRVLRGSEMQQDGL